MNWHLLPYPLSWAHTDNSPQNTTARSTTCQGNAAGGSPEREITILLKSTCLKTRSNLIPLTAAGQVLCFWIMPLNLVTQLFILSAWKLVHVFLQDELKIKQHSNFFFNPPKKNYVLKTDKVICQLRTVWEKNLPAC